MTTTRSAAATGKPPMRLRRTYVLTTNFLPILLVWLEVSLPVKFSLSLLLIPSIASRRDRGGATTLPDDVVVAKTFFGRARFRDSNNVLWGRGGPRHRRNSGTSTLAASQGQQRQEPLSSSTPIQEDAVLSESTSPAFAAQQLDLQPPGNDEGRIVGGPMLLLSLRHRLTTTNGADSGSELDTSSNTNKKIRLVLASQSPRRREILSMMGLEGRFDAVPSPLNEADVQQELQQPQEGRSVDPPQYAERLALAKATALADALRIGSHSLPGREDADEYHSLSSIVVVMGSDTIVELDGRILEKPVDESEAKLMLTSLSGREHLVHTGVAFACLVPSTSSSSSASSGKEVKVVVSSRSFVDTAAVKFVNLTPDDIDAYVSTGEPMDKAGSYGIQGIGGQMVESVTGDFFTVMGLPMCRVSQALARLLDELG